MQPWLRGPGAEEPGEGPLPALLRAAPYAVRLQRRVIANSRLLIPSEFSPFLPFLHITKRDGTCPHGGWLETGVLSLIMNVTDNSVTCLGSGLPLLHEHFSFITRRPEASAHSHGRGLGTWPRPAFIGSSERGTRNDPWPWWRSKALARNNFLPIQSLPRRVWLAFSSGWASVQTLSPHPHDCRRFLDHGWGRKTAPAPSSRTQGPQGPQGPGLSIRAQRAGPLCARQATGRRTPGHGGGWG